MKLDIFQIDAFAERPFEGNPAAVIPLTEWLPDATMQAIAEENNLAETAFFVPGDEGFQIRWFTPAAEVALCGHATLASAFVLKEYLNFVGTAVHFDSASGPLSVSFHESGMLELNFPAQPPLEVEPPEPLLMGLGLKGESIRCFAREDYVVLLESADDLLALNVDFGLLEKVDLRGVIATAPANLSGYDFFARFFAPKLRVPEDPVTGSAYTQLAPLWSKLLGKQRFVARQTSARGGDVSCSLKGDRVLIAGRALCYLRGEIEID